MNQTFQRINPVTPLVEALPGGINIGHELRIIGSTHLNASRFSVNLQCGPNTCPRDDVALHLTADFVRRLFIRNSIHGMAWGIEENQGGIPVLPGQQFQMTITCDVAQFTIVVNQAVFKMNHRIPFQKITHLTIDGDIIVNEISMRSAGYNAATGYGVPSYPPNAASYPPNTAPYPPNATPYGTGAYGPGYPNNYVQPNQNKGPLGSIGALGAGAVGAAIAARSVKPKKIMKHQKKMAKKALKYGVPIAGAGVGAYALSHAFHGHHHHFGHHHSSSSSSSSSSSD